MMQDWWQATFPQGRQTLTIEDANGIPIRLAYGEKGNGQPLILVHGIASWSYGWRGCIDELAQRFRVICLDAKGHGFSDKPLYPDRVGHQIIELQRSIEQLCDEPAIIVAQSLGALVTLGLAQEFPQLCDRLVLINVPIFADRLPSWWMHGLAILPLTWVKVVDRSRIIKPLSPIVRALTGFFRREVVTDPNTITPEEVYWITYPYIEMPNAIVKYAEDLQISLREIQAIAQPQPNLIRQIRDNLPTLTHPTLILWGEQDNWFPPQHGEKLHHHLPNAQFKTLPNCGHDASGSCPQPVTQAILHFLHPPIPE
ncbi:alpha/beta hydrolase [Spirulina sp. CS-785/01]|uniref:alpha/beta fold hydrolase n=1 Tax=Spirulina sp. CS-785/01 TaxID=3021716 RepID=UPI00232C5106|nr:alpha/beta hydrolase [Spirulina sp. CS-785/01]MDB9314340.1 alpha/beta hydrolase [Spirulina sp. CS-785/01]